MSSIKISISYKLFLTLLATSTIAAFSLFFFLQWNFDRGFLNYVKQQEIDQLELLVKDLKNEYQKQNTKNWDFFKSNHSLWQKLHMQLFSLPPRHHSFSPNPHQRRNSHSLPLDIPGDQRNIGPRILLFDKQGNWIIGGPHNYDHTGQLPKYPIQLNNDTIGYLSLIPPSSLSYSGDLLFLEEQTKAFMLVALAMLGMSLLLTFPLTIHLLKPINRLIRGTIALVGGKFSTRIPVRTSDELGTLSNHFNILAETLEKNEQARKQWVADISHELRTPLSILRGDVEALQDGVRVVTDKSINLIHNEIMHMERLVNDLYELSMSDIGALTYKKSPITPVTLLLTTLEHFDSKFKEKSIKITSTIKVKQSLHQLGDADRIQQLFINILENSLRYTDEPGILHITATSDQNTLILEFEDSSPGVSIEQLPHLFDRLYRTDPSRNRETYGAGLGLTLCKNIVEAHQGSIEATASKLGGIHIKIQLPIIE